MNPKNLYKLRKLQKELSQEIVEVEAGDGAVTIQVTGEQKVKKVILDKDKVQDFDKLERWLESAITQAITKSQQVAAEKMKSAMGGLGNLGL